jgi:hypothetical protein
MRKRRGIYRVLVKNQRKRDHLEDLGVDGRMVIKCILRKSVGKACTELIGLRIGTSGVLL